MWSKKLTWQLLLGHLAVMVLPLLIATWYTSSLYQHAFVTYIEDAEKRNGYLVAKEVIALFSRNDTALVNPLCRELSRDMGMRITVILPTGRVIGDSDDDPASMENHAYRPEMMKALKGSVGRSERYSTTLKKKMKYLALPIQKGNTLLGVVRTSIPAVSVSTSLNAYYSKIVFAVLLMIMAAFLLSYLLARRIILPIKELERGAERFSKGELSTKVVVPGIHELNHLASALNEMAQQLDTRIRTITAQRNEHEAILSSMNEGVIAVDTAERILSVNTAAAALFTIDRHHVAGKLLGEVIRNSAVQRFVGQVLSRGESQEQDITIPAPSGGTRSETVLQVHGTTLRDSENRCAGAVLVASDVTRLRPLETMRKEFVANVSHELRTPLTAIKGFVETLQQGALDSREEAARFVGIIAAQVGRLGALVDDLLTLARIEREEVALSISLVEGSIFPVVNSTLRDFSAQAAAKNIAVEIKGDPSIRAPIDPAMLEQAVGNLIDNAIKYSEPDRNIELLIEKRGNEAIISVSDQGIGIPAEHLDRIFERFYRVDKARSRKAGGTGLGLSIVKHIISLHNGRVTVQSVPKKGSSFIIALPLSKLADEGDHQ
ncbi:MAG: PAS domain-containing protein [Chitinispirillaceae bacterium]|nr:PAS domain-containing protein [Chitinispirillaceae bacterium]